jgi:hypothetical protein
MDSLLVHVRYCRRRACSCLASSSMPAQGVGEGVTSLPTGTVGPKIPRRAGGVASVRRRGLYRSLMLAKSSRMPAGPKILRRHDIHPSAGG